MGSLLCGLSVRGKLSCICPSVHKLLLFSPTTPSAGENQAHQQGAPELVSL